MYGFNSYPNRTLCDVLREMRECYKTMNFGAIMGLIEEAQIMGNRMEAGLEDKNDIKHMDKKKSKMKKELRELEIEIDKLTALLGKNKESDDE